ncbi:TetR family transcriptional regulator [Nocardia higoensis]|uniref:TetR family transcriptional regulator n=1 Tax=Nocardia higoensis TaxID=228599 RepID=UPI001FE055E0|nr:TetR family transcriptional regulator [Nocardia higoensis]
MSVPSSSAPLSNTGPPPAATPRAVAPNASMPSVAVPGIPVRRLPATPTGSGAAAPGAQAGPGAVRAPHEAIRAARVAAGLSLRELARRIAVSPATLSAIENGRTGLSVERLNDVAAALGLTAPQLLGGGSPAAPGGGSTETAAAGRNHGAHPDWRVFGPLDADPVLTAAIASFVDIGYHGTTVRALADRAGTSVPGLYHRYRDKQDLLVRILDLTMDELHWRVPAACADGEDAVTRVRLIVEALALFHTHRRELGFIGASEMRSLLPADRTRIARSRREIQRILDEEIESGRAAGDFDIEDPQAAGRAISTMCTGIAQWFSDRGPYTPEQIAAQYADFAIGLLTPARPA